MDEKGQEKCYEKKNNSEKDEINYDNVTCFKCNEIVHKVKECPNESKANNIQSLFSGAMCTIEETKEVEHNLNEANFHEMFDNFSNDDVEVENNWNGAIFHEMFDNFSKL